MANTGAKLPQSAATAAESPWLDNDWTTPQNIYGAGTASVTAASYDAGDQTYVLKAYNFDMSAIPDGATIDGVVCVVNGYYAVVVVSIDLVQLLNTSLGKTGTNQAATPQALTTGAADYTFGAANNKWGLALDAAWIKNSNFGVAIGCLAGGSGNSNNDVHIDSVTLTVYYTAAASLTVQNGSQAQAAENKLLSQVHNLTSQAAAQGQSEGNVLLVQQHILAIQNAAQAQTTENAVLTQVNILAVAIASEAQTVENIALSQVHNLSPPAVTQPQTVGNVDLVQQHLLAIQNAGQGQSAGNTSLTENKILVVQNASQWQRTRAKNIHSRQSLNFGPTSPQHRRSLGQPIVLHQNVDDIGRYAAIFG